MFTTAHAEGRLDALIDAVVAVARQAGDRNEASRVLRRAMDRVMERTDAE